MTTTPEQLEKSQQEAEDYLREKYGAYRGHFAWREIEDAFTTGYLRRCQETEQAIKDARKQALEEAYNLCEAVEIDTDTTSGKRAAARCVNEILKLWELLK